MRARLPDRMASLKERCARRSTCGTSNDSRGARRRAFQPDERDGIEVSSRAEAGRSVSQPVFESDSVGLGLQFADRGLRAQLFGAGNYACYERPSTGISMRRSRSRMADSTSSGRRRSGRHCPQGAATWVWLADVDHLYFKRENLHVAQQKPHGHGWSLVNNIDEWSWA